MAPQLSWLERRANNAKVTGSIPLGAKIFFLQGLFLQTKGLTGKGIGVPLAQWIARWTSNPKVLGSTPRWDGTYWSVSVVVITSALHAEGRQFEPGTDQILNCEDSEIVFWAHYLT